MFELLSPRDLLGIARLGRAFAPVAPIASDVS
jgi:hypothetical protein